MPSWDAVLDLWDYPTARLIVWTSVLAVLTVAGWYVAKRFRGSVDEADTTSDMLSKFREMRLRGHLAEEEFRNIRTHLDEKLKAELNQKKQGG